MALPDSLISAAAGLVGAGIGGLSTYLASRIQWRRESRRTVYASLIGVAYEVESFIAPSPEAPAGGDSSDSTDPRTQFYSQLDSATLLAKWNTQNALGKWRRLSPYLDKFSELEESERAILRDEWEKRRNEFYEFAKDELGVKGALSNRRALAMYLLLAIVSMVITAVIPGNNGAILGKLPFTVHKAELTAASWVFLLISTAFLILAFRAARRWRDPSNELYRVLKADVEDIPRRVLKTFDIIQVAIVVALVINLIVVFLHDPVITIFGVMILWLGILGQLFKSLGDILP
jgi:hypothetical protein